MNRLSLMQRVRSVTRDLSNSIFREKDINDYLNEGIERMQQVIPELLEMKLLLGNDDVPTLLPERYHHLISLYASSRCFGQDERHYQATNHMNEFENKLETLKIDIDSGVVVIQKDGMKVALPQTEEYVTNNYFSPYRTLTDLDEGVEGVL